MPVKKPALLTITLNLALSLATSPAYATNVRALTLDELNQVSSQVVRGHVVMREDEVLGVPQGRLVRFGAC